MDISFEIRKAVGKAQRAVNLMALGAGSMNRSARVG